MEGHSTARNGTVQKYTECGVSLIISVRGDERRGATQTGADDRADDESRRVREPQRRPRRGGGRRTPRHRVDRRDTLL